MMFSTRIILSAQPNIKTPDKLYYTVWHLNVSGCRQVGSISFIWLQMNRALSLTNANTGHPRNFVYEYYVDQHLQ